MAPPASIVARSHRDGEAMGAPDLVAETAGRYVHWGVIQISVTNLVIIGAMLVLFVLALVLPFPGHHGDDAPKSPR
jgi:hypothetical protein